MAEHGLLDLLPEVMRIAVLPGSPTAALGAVADDMHAPVEAVLDRIDDVVDPYRTPTGLLPYLAGWVDLGWLTTPGTGTGPRPAHGVAPDRLRDLVAASAELSARRGTVAGLARFLHLATGVDAIVVREVPRRFHVEVVVPRDAAVHADLVARLVRVLKPAHVTSDVRVEGEEPPDGPLPPAMDPAEAAVGAEPGGADPEAHAGDPAARGEEREPAADDVEDGHDG